ncbi:hypothetical protein DPMN_099717 [Dreissena polymorpha]|uniref:Uncharacterized protein n=1 Tax=Dreissena polymorpha TaxID=45954 RepID=A0A9D4R7Y1_DREPO|nr:hypothetical protein DPMN_099717 [Dreissena polymorpha]
MCPLEVRYLNKWVSDTLLTPDVNNQVASRSFVIYRLPPYDSMEDWLANVTVKW